MISNTIENWELLMIRQCKKNNPSKYIFARIYGVSRALPTLYCNNFEYINYALLGICLKFGLIRDIHEFILYDINPVCRHGIFPTKPYSEHLYHKLISTIACSPVKKFPRYPDPALIRHKYS